MTTPKRDEVEAVARDALKEAQTMCAAHLGRGGAKKPSWFPYVRKVKEKVDAAIAALDESRARDKEKAG